MFDKLKNIFHKIIQIFGHCIILLINLLYKMINQYTNFLLCILTYDRNLENYVYILYNKFFKLKFFN